MQTIDKSKIISKNCKGCGYTLTFVKEFEGLPCNTYCCGCCPDAKQSPCEKERLYGGMFSSGSEN